MRAGATLAAGSSVTCAESGGARDGESHCVPKTLRRRPTTTAGISEIAECFQNILRWDFAFDVPEPCNGRTIRSQGKPCGMRPGAVFQFRHRHEVGTGQFGASQTQKLLGLAIVISWRRSGQFILRIVHFSHKGRRLQRTLSSTKKHVGSARRHLSESVVISSRTAGAINLWTVSPLSTKF